MDAPITRKLRRAFYAVDDAIVLLDVEGRVDQYNHAASSLLASSHAPEGQTFASIIGPTEDTQTIEATIEKARAGRRECEVTLANRQYRMNADPVFDDRGRLEGIVVVLSDISGAERLAQKDREQAAEVVEEKRRKEEFLGMLAHELRNPLNAISAANAMLTANHSDKAGHSRQASVEKLQSVIGRQVKHLARFIEDLVEVSRVTRGQVQLRARPIEIAPVIARAAAEMRPAFEGRRQSLTISTGSAPLVVQGDAVRLEQALYNLLSNAAKYSPPATTIDIDAREVMHEGQRVVEIAVTDQGIGIDPAMLTTIFEPFVQLEPSIARTAGGLGIGLTMVKSFVELHRGSVVAQSAGSGRGARFVMRLPLLSSSVTVAPATRPPPSPQQTTQPLSILVVEDNPDALELVTSYLEALGHTAHGASDGQSGLDLAIAIAPDVAIIDVGLPGFDGYEVARRIRSSDLGAHVYLVALTGYGRPEDRARAFDAGFDAHIVKPIDPDKLERLLDRSPRDAAATA